MTSRRLNIKFYMKTFVLDDFDEILSMSFLQIFNISLWLYCFWRLLYFFFFLILACIPIGCYLIRVGAPFRIVIERESYFTCIFLNWHPFARLLHFTFLHFFANTLRLLGSADSVTINTLTAFFFDLSSFSCYFRYEIIWSTKSKAAAVAE